MLQVLSWFQEDEHVEVPAQFLLNAVRCEYGCDHGRGRDHAHESGCAPDRTCWLSLSGQNKAGHGCGIPVRIKRGEILDVNTEGFVIVIYVRIYKGGV